jgi:enoyl-CoA hydratase
MTSEPSGPERPGAPTAPGGAIHLRRTDDVARIVVGTGDRGNALSSHDWDSLAELFDRLADDAELRVAVVEGASDTFSAGSDVREWVASSPAAVDAGFAAMERAFSAVEALPVPVLAKVRGIAVGAGCQLACACDLRVLGERARIGMPIARWGILASPSFAARISALTGPDVTRDLLYTGRLLDAAEAQRVGLASRVAPEDELDSVLDALVEQIARQPPAAIRAAKQAVSALMSPITRAARQAGGGPAADYPALRSGAIRFLDPGGSAASPARPQCSTNR